MRSSSAEHKEAVARLKEALAQTKREEEEALKLIPPPTPRKDRPPKGDDKKLAMWHLWKLEVLASNGFGGSRFKSWVERAKVMAG